MSIWQLPMGTGFLFPSSQPVPASKSWEPDQKCLQMLRRVAKLCQCNGMAWSFQLQNKVVVSKCFFKYEKSSAFRENQACETQDKSYSGSNRVYCLFCCCSIHMLLFGNEMIDFPLLSRCSEPWVPLKGPAVLAWHPAMVDSVMQLTSIRLLQPAESL